MKSYTITVNGTVYDVTVEEKGAGAPAAAPAALPPFPRARRRGRNWLPAAWSRCVSARKPRTDRPLPHFLPDL